jgi:hypothetical protein
MTQLERDIERALVGMIKRQGGFCLKWVCPGWIGVPDRIILLPRGRVIFAELKRPKGGEIAKMQEWWAGKLKGLGFKHIYVKNRNDIQMLEQFIREL